MKWPLISMVLTIGLLNFFKFSIFRNIGLAINTQFFLMLKTPKKLHIALKLLFILLDVIVKRKMWKRKKNRL